MDRAEVVEAWDRAGRSPEAAVHVHPLGDDHDAWLASGAALAAEIETAWYRHQSGAPRVVLDFGCGLGRVTRFLLFDGVEEVYGVDSSGAMIGKVIAEEWARSGPFGWWTSDGSDLRGQRGDDGCEGIDLVVANAVFIHHSHADGAALLVELSRCLESGGMLMADIPCYDLDRERADWCDVTVWTTDLLLAAANAADLVAEEIHSSPGIFSFEDIGAEHGALQIFRKL